MCLATESTGSFLLEHTVFLESVCTAHVCVCVVVSVLCVCVCVFIWWYILDRQGKLIRKGKLV